MSAVLDGDLWVHNLAHVVLVDVTDDYRRNRRPQPVDCYPILGEIWLPTVVMPQRLAKGSLIENYLYDWHERPSEGNPTWYVGVVHSPSVKAAEV
jgi:hypothetical protein